MIKPSGQPLIQPISRPMTLSGQPAAAPSTRETAGQHVAFHPKIVAVTTFYNMTEGLDLKIKFLNSIKCEN
jgi:hypothetical protein